VIEDIDCLTDVVMDRSITGTRKVEGDAVTLSFLLNLLDGVLETPGRILVITSNFPEKLDRAFVRPGRIDVQIEFKHAGLEFVLDMVNKFYSIEYGLKEIPVCLENVFTPAEIMESLCTYFKDPVKAIAHMVAKVETKRLGGFQTGTILTSLLEEDATKQSGKKQAIPNAPVKQEMEYGWSSANFGDAEFLPGGSLPGEKGVRSKVDFNIINSE
jgi:hypothetical protein